MPPRPTHRRRSHVSSVDHRSCSRPRHQRVSVRRWSRRFGERHLSSDTPEWPDRTERDAGADASSLRRFRELARARATSADQSARPARRAGPIASCANECRECERHSHSHIGNEPRSCDGAACDSALGNGANRSHPCCPCQQRTSAGADSESRSRSATVQGQQLARSTISELHDASIRPARAGWAPGSITADGDVGSERRDSDRSRSRRPRFSQQQPRSSRRSERR